MILPRRRKRDSFLPWVQFFTDIASIYFFLWFCFWFRFESGFVVASKGVPNYEMYFKTFHFTALILIFFFRHYGLYRPLKLSSFSGEISSIFKAVISALIVLMALTFFYRGFSFSRVFIVFLGVVIATGVSLSRFLLSLLILWVDKRRGAFHQFMIFCCDDNARKLARYYAAHPRFRTKVDGFMDANLSKGTLVEGVPVVGSIAEFGIYIRSNRHIHEVVLASQGLPEESILQMIYECEKHMVTFYWIADVFGLIASRMRVVHLAGLPLLSFTDSPLADWENRFLKRVMDIAVSVSAFIILSPLFILLYVLVKKGSPGPVFYSQERVGEDGRRFRLYKFRTMKVGAENATGPVWAKEEDPRRTPLGKILRKYNLDEIPQLWNVLIGDMSLVGPRPERPFFVSQFKEDIPRYMARHTIKSGLTGWAQVNGLRGNTSIEERTKFDLFYVENWSLFLDIRILFKTLFTFFSSPNAY